MDLIGLLFGKRPHRAPLLRAVPADAQWHSVHAREGAPPVSAKLADRDGSVRTRGGSLHYRKGEHYLVQRGGETPSVVRRDLFERMYRERPDGRYEKRTDVAYRYFTLPTPVTVVTLEGPQRAAPGDWIMQGLAGELWPIPPKEAESKYVAVAA